MANETRSNPNGPVGLTRLRVRYSETDQMGTFYNAVALEWFECGRTDLLRTIGTPYVDMESRGVLLPLVEAHVHYTGRARYDDPLTITTTAELGGRARLRFNMKIVHESGSPVADGYTIHAFTNADGRPIRPPEWFIDALKRGNNS
jgi:acyl-CoA thioester hydrolase